MGVCRKNHQDLTNRCRVICLKPFPHRKFAAKQGWTVWTIKSIQLFSYQKHAKAVYLVSCFLSWVFWCILVERRTSCLTRRLWHQRTLVVLYFWQTIVSCPSWPRRICSRNPSSPGWFRIWIFGNIGIFFPDKHVNPWPHSCMTIDNLDHPVGKWKSLDFPKLGEISIESQSGSINYEIDSSCFARV